MDNRPKKISIDEGLRIASQHFEEGKYHACSELYSAILKAKPDMLIANQRMAVINESFGNYEEALSFYKNIVRYHPMDAGFLSGYIRLSIKMGNITEARKTLERTTNIFAKARDGDQFNSLVKQLNPERKLEFFYKYLGSLGVFDYETDQLMTSNSKAIPLLTNSFLCWFETQNWAGKTLLELGSGSSTLYFAKHFERLISWETNKNWFSTLSEVLPINVEYEFVESIMNAFKSFDVNSCDVILLDCAENRANIARAISEKGFKGIVFFDNSEWYRNGISFLTRSSFLEIPFFGLKPVEDWVSCTSVLFSDNNTNDMLSSNWKALPDFANYMPNNSWDIAENQ